ncbi:MAG TPA: helical backbone metal receptor [Tenuifilaceae bacterium]|nr:helical backbone metal receptor [Tenuifilaceae bacterium]HPI45229.1 helical backbone metal receptor [Tenuifilaceae bacterium]HPV56479.1 helical backbone metal receptor [Tenuifilaceae bacterium]
MVKRIFKLLSIALISISQNYSVFGQTPTRIVSLAPSLTKNVYFLEQQHKLVGCTSYCDTAVANGKEVVASAVKVNIEKVVSLKPDLVITTTMTNPETLDMLKKFNIRVETFPTAKSFDEICKQTIRLGQIIGAESNAKRIVTQSEIKIKSLASSTRKDKSPSVFFQIGAKPLFTVIPGTFMNDYIVFAGGKNIVTNTKTGSITREAVIASNPDVIFVVTMGIVGEEEKKIWESYSTINAAKNKKVFIIDSNDSCTPTPVTFVKTLERIIDLIYSK